MMCRYTITNQVGTLKFNAVYGPPLTDLLSRYTGFMGRPALPPPLRIRALDLVRHLARRGRG